MRYKFALSLEYFGIWLLCLGLFSCTQQDTISQPQPNVLLILTDDQGYGDVGIHGNDSIDTPVQDRLASQGVRMDNFYVSPVCAPTRASLLTGRYHYRTGTSWVTRNGEAMRSEEVTLAEIFQANGYATGIFGKWHNGAHYPEHPLGQGFEEFTGFCAGHWNYYMDPNLEANGAYIKGKGYITDILTDSAMSFMRRHQDQPFFCYVPYNTPHTPYIVPDAYYQKYKAKGLSDKVACTYGMVENIDDNIGRMLDMLEENGQLENTLVIFITDNGPNYDRYNGNMKGRKGWVTDGGVRVPSFWYWKGKLQTGAVSQALTAHIDVLPTLVDLLKLTPVETLPLDGVSFANVLLGSQDTLPQRELFTFHVNDDRYRGSVRTSNYRLVVSDPETYELTDLLNDRMQTNDLTDSLSNLSSELYEEYLTVYEEVTAKLENFPPIPIGYDEAPEVELFAHEGFFTGNIQYKASEYGWANDWFTHWTSMNDTMYWNVEVVDEVEYEVWIKYTSLPEQIGATIALAQNSQVITTTLSESFIPEKTPDQDIVKREVEAYDQTWGEMKMGELKLMPGKQTIKLYANDIPKSAVGDVKAIILR